MITLSQNTEDWDKLFVEVSNNHALREKARLTYDHYDEKLERILKVKNDKAYRNIQESEKEIKSFERVIKINYITYRMMKNIKKQLKNI